MFKKHSTQHIRKALTFHRACFENCSDHTFWVTRYAFQYSIKSASSKQRHFEKTARIIHPLAKCGLNFDLIRYMLSFCLGIATIFISWIYHFVRISQTMGYITSHLGRDVRNCYTSIYQDVNRYESCIKSTYFFKSKTLALKFRDCFLQRMFVMNWEARRFKMF